MATELVYRYARESSVGPDGLALATSAAEAPAGLYFRGFLERPDMGATALLCVARVARTSFYTPPGSASRRFTDPVVTSEPGALRFESFSGCCGVHARFDVLPDGHDADVVAPGTVNVDFNEPMRAALARIVARSPLRLQVGHEAVELETLEGTTVERRVPLPDRWVKGFAEVQVAVAGLEPVLSFDAVAAQRFLRGLPGGKATLWAREGRLSARPGGGAVCVAAPERLRVLQPVARFLTGLTAYAVPDEEAASVWVAELPGARLLVTLSPHFSRGFSGEGGLLEDLADDALAIEAEFLDRSLHGRWRFASDELGATGLDPERARRALSWLGAHGRIGFDPVEQVWFRRELPFPSGGDPPRLRDAKRLVDSVVWRGPGEAEVRTYAVRLDPPRCTCAWWSRHPGDRGPCKHLLAAQIAARSLAPELVLGQEEGQHEDQRRERDDRDEHGVRP